MTSNNKFLWDIHTAVKKIRIPGSDEDKRFLAMSLYGEVGEVANLVKKKWRGDDLPNYDIDFREEMGDVYAYLILFAMAYDMKLFHYGMDDNLPPETFSDNDKLYFTTSLLCARAGRIVDFMLMPWALDRGAQLTTGIRSSVERFYSSLVILAKQSGVDLDDVLNNVIIPKIQSRWGHLVK